ncbi:MAG: hypothetical protein OXH43_04605 [Acidimicrobiaceae bacterium]|nr:hypothetical protein [Gemmatimonadota bacterium]MDE0515592.1 hypothetical protein [Acidimicrobiaceae bacterium]
MPALGFSCSVRDRRIVVRGVLLRDGTAEEVFHFAAARGEDLALQMRSLGNALDTRLKDLEVESVVVRTADHYAARSLAEYVAIRLRGEGVLLSTARAHVDRVVCLTGRAIGERCGTSKPKIDARAAELLSEKQKEATAAALAAERLRSDASHL